MGDEKRDAERFDMGGIDEGLKEAYGEERLRQAAEHVSEEDVGDLVGREDEFGRHVSKAEKTKRFAGKIRHLVDDLKLLWCLLKAWLGGKYRGTPWWVMASAVFAIGYFLNPFDAIPDVLPAIGFLDDASVVGIVIISIHEHLERFKSWIDETGYECSTGEFAKEATAEEGAR